MREDRSAVAQAPSPLSACPPPQVLPDGTPWPQDAIEVGKVVAAWGIKGGIKVAPFSADPQALFGTKRWYLLPPAGGELRCPPRLLKIKTAKEQGDAIVAMIDDIDDRNIAETFKGARIFVSRTAFPTPDTDEFYWVDLIGLRVVNLQGEHLGDVVGLLETGPHCVLRCQPSQADEPERLIPFVSAFVQRVSLQERLIEADWGLDY